MTHGRLTSRRAARRAVALLFFCLVSTSCSGTGSGVRLDSSIDPATFGALIYVDGSIDESMHDAIVRTVNSVNSRRLMLQLNSRGGSTKAGFEIIDYLSQLKREGYTITTYVEQECDSMCIPIYMQGSIRLATPTSRWVFHDARNPFGTDERATTRMLSELATNGADNGWLTCLLLSNVFVGGNWIAYSGERLKREQSNIVTELVVAGHARETRSESFDPATAPSPPPCHGKAPS